MEEMKINSKTGYNKSRIMNGHGPHNMMKMEHQKMLAKLAKQEKCSELDWKSKEDSNCHEFTEVEK
ncbi:MAG: hypothetical protein P1Q69_06480 [Candidatus Thorarchaeota archaeon]|nr:hypothetical protein [Candidatus Thorarchaeota archaeon]